MAILTISQEMGSGGAEIGLTVATRLGYTYVDNEELLSRAQRYGLAEERLARLAEDRPTWIERFDAETRRCIMALQSVLYEFAQDDDVVLMGGGGQWLLRGVPHALRTRIVAPFSRARDPADRHLVGPGAGMRDAEDRRPVPPAGRHPEIGSNALPLRRRPQGARRLRCPHQHRGPLPRVLGGPPRQCGSAARLLHHGRGEAARGRSGPRLSGGGRPRWPS